MFTPFRRICVSLALLTVTAATLTAQNTVLTAPLDLTHGKPFVMVMVNGKGPFRFVIDTGTGAEAFVTAELADTLNLPVAGQVHLSDPSKQGGQRVPIVLIQSLEVAGVVFTDVKAVRHPLSDADGNCDGLLGFELFRDYLLTLDFPHRRMTLASGSLTPDGEQSVLPFRMPDGIPIVPLRIGGVQIEAQIDSGGTGLSLPEDFVSRLKFDSDPEVFGIGESISTRFELKAAKLASDIHLGSYTFTRPFVEIHSAFPLANLGSCAMQNFVFTFDQKAGLVQFESSQQTLHLAATPTPLRTVNSPPGRQAYNSLVPIG
jgi:Aspartyl protease